MFIFICITRKSSFAAGRGDFAANGGWNSDFAAGRDDFAANGGGNNDFAARMAISAAKSRINK